MIGAPTRSLWAWILPTILLAISLVGTIAQSQPHDQHHFERPVTGIKQQHQSSQFTPLRPQAIPLAVRTPYLSAWFPGGSTGGGDGYLNRAWPRFWTGSYLGWKGFVRVDGVTYIWMGYPSDSVVSANQTSFVYTATQSIFTFEAGPVELTARFFSPIETEDLLRQSLPYSYLAVDVSSRDGRKHHVAVYTDISGEWISGDGGRTANWTYHDGGGFGAHRLRLVHQDMFTQVDEHIHQGEGVYAVRKSSGDSTFWSGGEDWKVRSAFIKTGRLPNKVDRDFRSINRNWPVFGFSVDLGNVVETSEEVVFVIGHVRDPVVTYVVGRYEMQDRHLYYRSKYEDDLDALSFFISDYKRSLDFAGSLDRKFQGDSARFSDDYAAIVALSARQTFAASEVTISRDSKGRWNTSDVLIFQKEISSGGLMNTADVIYPAFPMYLYVAPAQLKYLLEPLLRYQATGLYPLKSALHDMGWYPVARGHNDGDDEPMPVEESGNMILMALAYYQATNDSTHLERYYGLFDRWSQFLVNDSLVPAYQLSTDDFAGLLANQTNLALKGLIGISAMAEISKLVGYTANSVKLNEIVKSYIPLFLNYSIAADGSHTKLAYQEEDSWGLLYNLYMDKLLGLNIIPKRVYQLQSDLVMTWLSLGRCNGKWRPTVGKQIGVPLDSRRSWTKSDWIIFQAGALLEHDPKISHLLVTAIADYIRTGRSDAPFGDWYETGDGSAYGFRNRPVVGGHAALLLLKDQLDQGQREAVPFVGDLQDGGSGQLVFGQKQF